MRGVGVRWKPRPLASRAPEQHAGRPQCEHRGAPTDRRRNNAAELTEASQITLITSATPPRADPWSRRKYIEGNRDRERGDPNATRAGGRLVADHIGRIHILAAPFARSIRRWAKSTANQPVVETGRGESRVAATIQSTNQPICSDQARDLAATAGAVITRTVQATGRGATAVEPAAKPPPTEQAVDETQASAQTLPVPPRHDGMSRTDRLRNRELRQDRAGADAEQARARDQRRQAGTALGDGARR